MTDRPAYFATIDDSRWKAVVLAVQALFITTLGICDDLLGRERSIVPRRKRG